MEGNSWSLKFILIQTHPANIVNDIKSMNAGISTFEPTTMVIALVILSVVMLCTLTAFAWMYFHFQNISAQQDEILQNIQQDLSAICNGAVGVGQHLARLEQKSVHMTQLIDKLEMQEAPEISYKQAIKMVRKGANLDQIMLDCGLAQGEAELILLSKNIN